MSIAHNLRDAGRATKTTKLDGKDGGPCEGQISPINLLEQSIALYDIGLAVSCPKSGGKIVIQLFYQEKGPFPTVEEAHGRNYPNAGEKQEGIIPAPRTLEPYEWMMLQKGRLVDKYALLL